MASKALRNQSLSSCSSSLVISITKTLSLLRPYFITNFPQNKPDNIPILSPFSPHLNPNLVIQVINNQTNPYHALIFFKWATNPSPNPSKYSHNFQCYIAMLDFLLSHRLFTTAVQFLEMHNKLSDLMISKIIKAFGVDRNVRGAIDMFYKAKMVVKDGNCISSLNCLLGVLVCGNRIKLAAAIYDRAVAEARVKIDVITYTTVICGYCKVGRIEDARKVFDEMKCKPNRVTYGTMLYGFCKVGMMVEARQLVDKMIMSSDCLPDVVTYGTLIHGYCRNCDMERAMMCLDEMVEQCIEPNLVTYNTIVNGYCVIGKVDEAKKMMTKMRLNGVKEDVVTHTSLLRGYCVGGRLDEAAEHFQEMMSLGFKADVQSYGLLLNECCKLGKVNEVIALMRDMVGRGVQPGVSSCNAVINVLVERGELDEAVGFLKWMPEIGCAPNFKSFSTVISSLSKTGRRVQQVEELVNTMLQKGRKLDRNLYSCLVSMYTEGGQLETASQVFSDALKERCVMINCESFAAFLEGLCMKGKICEAEQRAQELLKRCTDIQLESYQRVLTELKCKYSDEKC